MTLIAQRTITGAEVRPNVALDRRRRRLSTIVAGHADRSRPFLVSVHRRGQPVAANDLDIVLRDEWKAKLVGPQDIVLITYLPLGGGGKGGGILMAIASIALAIIVPFAVAAIPGLGAVGGGLTLMGKIVSTGIIMGGMALLGQAFKPKANKQEPDKPVYGVSGGGNLPRPGDRIPRLYGRCWTVPDLSQPDFFTYEGGEYQILHKRMTVTLGRAQIHAIRVNGQTMWTETGGVRSPFAGTQVEIINPGERSALVPLDVVSAPAVQGNELARPDSPAGTWTGPFLVADLGVTISKIQIDISAPQGLILNYANREGAQEGAVNYGWEFQYIQVSETGGYIGSWKTLDSLKDTKLSRRPMRWTRLVKVPEGRYMVRGRNRYTNVPFNDKQTGVTNALQWDGLRGHISDYRVRDHVTEVAIKVKSNSALGVTSFANVEVEASGIIPVWTGTSWVNQVSRKAVWIYADIMRNTSYGAALPASALDLDTLKFYADELRRWDTFDGVIRGPDSVWNVASTVLFPMRAEPVQLGRVWSIVRDDRKDVRPHVITSRQIVGGSSGLSFDLDPDNGEAHLVAEYYEKADPRRLIQLPDIYYGNKSNTPTRRSLFGVKTKDHATHLARWLAASAFYRRQSVQFQTEYDGRIYKRGDPITVETWFASNMKVASVLEQLGDTLTLDRTVTVAASDQIILRDRSGREWGPAAIDTAGTTDEIVLNASSRASVEASTGLTLSQALALDGMEETTVLIGPGTTLSRQFIIKMARPSGRDRMDIEAVIDHQSVWNILNEPITEIPEEDDVPDPTPPRNLAVSERLYLDGGLVLAVARVSWQRTSSRALVHEVEYRVDYRLPEVDPTDADTVLEDSATDGQWIPAGATDGSFLEITGLPSAQMDVRVRAVYSADNVSAWITLNDVLISGTTKPPGEVTNLTASVLGDVLTLAWTGPADVHLSHYEVRFSPQLSGVVWGTAVPLLPRVATPSAQVPAAVGTYLVKAVSRAGVSSTHAALVTSDVAGLSQLNVIEVFTEHPTFAGPKDRVVKSAALNGIHLDYIEDIFAREDVFAPGLDFFLGEADIASEGTYGFANALDLGAVYTSRVTPAIEAYGLNLTNDLFAVDDIFAMEDVFQTAAAATWDVNFEYRSTNDNPAGTPIWSEWRPVIVGDVTARALEFRVRLQSYEFGVTPIVTRLEVSVDMPDRVAAGDNLAATAAGRRVTFTPPFVRLEGLAITAEGLASGDRHEITGKDETGFTIQFFNASGAAIARTFDYVAKGYGRREA